MYIQKKIKIKKYHPLETIDFLQLKNITGKQKNDKPIPPPHLKKNKNINYVYIFMYEITLFS